MTKNEKHLNECRARAKFQRKLEQLRLELRLGAARRHLDHLLDHLDDLLSAVGENTLRDAFRAQLEDVRGLVHYRHELRLIRGGAR